MYTCLKLYALESDYAGTLALLLASYVTSGE